MSIEYAGGHADALQAPDQLLPLLGAQGVAGCAKEGRGAAADPGRNRPFNSAADRRRATARRRTPTWKKNPRMDESARLANVAFVSIAQTRQRQIGEFILDPDILLPVELPAGTHCDCRGGAELGGDRRRHAQGAGVGHGQRPRRILPAIRARGEAGHQERVHARRGSSRRATAMLTLRSRSSARSKGFSPTTPSR